jgi:hypothetical protein
VSRRRKLRRAIRWARYVNHYGHRPDVTLGGRSASAAIWWSWATGRHSYLHVRRQAGHRFGEGS